MKMLWQARCLTELCISPTSIASPINKHDTPKRRNKDSRNRDDQSYEKLASPNGDFAVPTLEELGFPAATPKHRGGETEALQLLDRIIVSEAYTVTFEKPKTAPAAFEPQATALLSPHLHFGSLSIREFYWRVQNVVRQIQRQSLTP